jgi:hypothetical protein
MNTVGFCPEDEGNDLPDYMSHIPEERRNLHRVRCFESVAMNSKILFIFPSFCPIGWLVKANLLLSFLNTRAILKVTSGELLTKHVARKNCII